jgi:UTP:GlnB (protein PII) uridylyltransferase
MGLMQYDLFHIYTVDAHTLLLIRNLNRFKEPEFAQHFPVVSSVFQRLARRDIIWLRFFMILPKVVAVIIVNWVLKMPLSLS